MNTTRAAGQDRATLPLLADGASEGVYTGRGSAPTTAAAVAARRHAGVPADYQIAHPESRALTQPNCPPRSNAP